jgi:hypothetical protein
MYGGISMKVNRKKTEEQIVIEYLLKQGGRELTEEEKKSPMYKETIESARRLVEKKKG